MSVGTGLDIEKVDWESKEVIVHAPTGQPDFDAVLAKIEKTGVSPLGALTTGESLRDWADANAHSQKKVNTGHDNGVQRYPKPDGEAQA